MTPAADELKSALQQLPESDRAELASFLLRSLEDRLPPPNMSSDEPFGEMLERRFQEMKEGRGGERNAFEVIAELRSQRGLRNGT